MAEIQSLYRYINRYARGVPEPTMEFTIRESAREFCEETWFYRRTETLEIVANRVVYDLVSGNSDDEIIGIKTVTLKGVPLFPTKPEFTRRKYGYPDEWFFEPPASIWFLPIPDTVQDEPFEIRLILKPTPTTTIIPEELCRNWAEKICFGALSRILMIPKQPWTDMNMAAKMQKEFLNACVKAKSDANRGFIPHNQRARPRPFAI